MKHIKSFRQINEEFRSTQKLRGHIFENKNNDALDQILEVWSELEEPIECINGWYKLLNYKQISSILAKTEPDDIGHQFAFAEASDYLGNKIITLIKKMKDICTENRLVSFYFGSIISHYEELWPTINNIFHVLPTNSEEAGGLARWKDEFFENDKRRFYIGYQAYKNLPDLIQKYKEPVNT